LCNERAVRESDYVPHNRVQLLLQSIARISDQAGVGTKGTSITGEVLTPGNQKKNSFQIFRESPRLSSPPSWLVGKNYGIGSLRRPFTLRTNRVSFDERAGPRPEGHHLGKPRFYQCWQRVVTFGKTVRVSLQDGIEEWGCGTRLAIFRRKAFSLGFAGAKICDPTTFCWRGHFLVVSAVSTTRRPSLGFCHLRQRLLCFAPAQMLRSQPPQSHDLMGKPYKGLPERCGVPPKYDQGKAYSFIQIVYRYPRHGTYGASMTTDGLRATFYERVPANSEREHSRWTS